MLSDDSAVDRAAKPGADLAQRLARYEESALEAVLRTYGPVVGAVLRRKYVILNVHDVEDILAVALGRLWTLRQKFDPTKGSVRATFFRIADQTAQDLFRRSWHKVRQCEVSLQDICPHEFGARSSTECLTETASSDTRRAQLQEDMRQIVERLPAPYRHIVLADACARDRVAAAEFLAEELDIAESTVRKYRSRAMAAIRTELRKLGYLIP